MRWTRRWTAAIAAGALVLGACGEHEPAEQRLRAAPEATAAEDTARFSIENATEMGREGSARMDMTVVGEGEVDFAAGQWRMAMEVPGMPGGDQGMEMVADGEAIYLRMALDGVDDDRWMRHDLDEEEGAGSPMGPGAFGAGAGTDPTDGLEVLASARGDIDELESASIDGVGTRGYGFEVTALELFGLDVDASGAEHLEQAEVRVEAWLDADDRARRIRYTVDMAPMMAAMQAWAEEAEDGIAFDEGAVDGGSSGDDERGVDPTDPPAGVEEDPEDPPAGVEEAPADPPAGIEGDDSEPDELPAVEGTQTTTIEWFDFGEPVDIVLPDEADVVGQDEFLEQQMGSDAAVLEGDGFVEDDVVGLENEGVVVEEEGHDSVVEPEAGPAD